MIATGTVSGPTRAQQGDPEQHPAQREEQVRGERPTTRVIVLSATSAFGATSAIQGPAKPSNHMFPPWVMMPAGLARNAFP